MQDPLYQWYADLVKTPQPVSLLMTVNDQLRTDGFEVGPSKHIDLEPNPWACMGNDDCDGFIEFVIDTYTLPKEYSDESEDDNDNNDDSYRIESTPTIANKVFVTT